MPNGAILYGRGRERRGLSDVKHLDGEMGREGEWEGERESEGR